MVGFTEFKNVARTMFTFKNLLLATMNYMHILAGMGMSSNHAGVIGLKSNFSVDIFTCFPQ